MKYIKEEVLNQDGKCVYIETFLGRKTQCVLSDSEKFISPIVSEIEYDQENNAFKFTDECQEITEEGCYGSIKANIYYYLDFSGNPIGLAYSDVLNKMYDFKIKNDSTDNWFQGYQEFKTSMGIALGEEMRTRRSHYGACAKKMLGNPNNK